MVINKSISDFEDVESLVIEVVPKCGSCRCGSCPIGGKRFTLKEERELTLIESGLMHHEEKCTWEARLSWIRNPCELPDNRMVALAVLKATEKRLLKNQNYALEYNNQVCEMVKEKVAMKVAMFV